MPRSMMAGEPRPWECSWKKPPVKGPRTFSCTYTTPEEIRHCFCSNEVKYLPKERDAATGGAYMLHKVTSSCSSFPLTKTNLPSLSLCSAINSNQTEFGIRIATPLFFPVLCEEKKVFLNPIFINFSCSSRQMRFLQKNYIHFFSF